MAALSVKPWTNLEHWTLFTFYKGDSEEDWHARAAADMEATRKSRIENRPKGFFTPAKCKAEFERIMAEPCPSDVPTGADYSRAAVVDAWIKHFTEEDRKDAELFDELMQVKIRSYEERLAKAWGNRDSYRVEQWEKMLDEIKKEEEEVDCDEEEAEYRERVGAIYYKHLSEMFYSQREKKASQQNASHSPRKLLSQRSRDAGNTQSRFSPTKSPIRSVADDEELTSGTVKEEDTVEKMEIDDMESKSSDGNSLDSPRSQPDSKRPRGRPPKKSSSTTLLECSSTPNRVESPLPANASEEQKSPARSETRRSTTRSEATASPSASSGTEKDSIQVVDSPAGRVRGARRPLPVDSPLLAKSSNVGRTSAGADAKNMREASRERDFVKSSQSTDVISLSTGVVTDEFGGIATQTALSIQLPLISSADGNFVSSRKSSRSDRRSTSTTNSASANSSRTSVTVQTGQVKFDMDESIVVGWPLSDMKMAPPTTSVSEMTCGEEIFKTAHCKSDQNSRIVSWDSVLDGSYDKKMSESSKIREDRVHNWDVCYCNFSEEALQVAKDLALTQTLGEKNSLSLVASPPKRMRKEEKPTSSSSLTPKGRMMSTWNSLQEHRHSAVFLHPVTDRDAPGYSRIVFCPVDLTTLKREIDNNAITNPTILLKKMFLMFTNAIMFNSTGHDVNYYAKEMCDATTGECTLTMDSRMDAFRVHNRRSRQHDDPRRRSSLTPTGQSRAALRKKQQ